MPIFDWECQICGHVWEERVKMDEEPSHCPKDVANAEDGDEQNLKHAAWSGEKQIKKLPSLFGKHVSWSKWRALN
jgi:hypothetical protein